MSRATKLGLIPAILFATACSSSTDARGNPITSVEIATSSVVLSQAETKLITATIRDADGNTMENVSGVTWTSANNALVSVTQGGQVRGVALGGPVTVTVSVEGKSATVSVTVVPAKIDITPGTTTLALGSSRQLNGVPLDFEQNPIPGAGSVTWSSNNNEVATVSSTGLVNTVAVGNALISGSVAGRTSGLNLEVGVPSALDGHWTGTNSVSILNAPVRPFAIEFDVVFGTVRAFRFMIDRQGCPLDIAASEGAVPIVNNGFSLLIRTSNLLGATPGTVTGTFTSSTSMTAVQGTFSLGGVGCGGPVAQGAMMASRQ